MSPADEERTTLLVTLNWIPISTDWLDGWRNAAAVPPRVWHVLDHPRSLHACVHACPEKRCLSITLKICLNLARFVKSSGRWPPTVINANPDVTFSMRRRLEWCHPATDGWRKKTERIPRLSHSGWWHATIIDTLLVIRVSHGLAVAPTWRLQLAHHLQYPTAASASPPDLRKEASLYTVSVPLGPMYCPPQAKTDQ